MSLRNARLRLRAARDDDCRRLWHWANDRQVRAASFSTGPIPWEEHRRWFAARQRDPGCRMLIAIDQDDAAVGQIRFDSSGAAAAKVSVSVDRNRRKAGYGSLIIELGVSRVTAETPLRTVDAYIRMENRASIRAFEKAGFSKCGVETVCGVEAYHYVRNSDSKRENYGV